jgi:hypothetical protein
MIVASVSTISTTIGRSNDRNRGLGGSRDPAFLSNRARDHGRRRNASQQIPRARRLVAVRGSYSEAVRPRLALSASFNARCRWSSIFAGLARECLEVRIRTMAAASNGGRPRGLGNWQSRKSGSLRWKRPWMSRRNGLLRKMRVT